MPLPIDRYANSSANNYSDRYATKHQDVAPQTHSTQSSWTQGSSNTGASAPLLDKQPYSAMSPSRQKELDQLKKTKDALEKLPVDFPTPALQKRPTNPLSICWNNGSKSLRSAPEAKTRSTNSTITGRTKKPIRHSIKKWGPSTSKPGTYRPVAPTLLTETAPPT